MGAGALKKDKPLRLDNIEDFENFADENFDYDEYVSEQAAIKSSTKQKQVAAVTHVIKNIYPYAPVKVVTNRYPKGHTQAGQAYIWVTIDLRDPRVENIGSLTSYPDGAAIDLEGNITISHGSASGGASPTRRISAAMVMNSTVLPKTPRPPILLERTKTTITLVWRVAKSTMVEHSEVQYRPCQGGTCTWKTLGRYDAEEREGTMENVTPPQFFEFRVKLKNPMGWSEWSEPSEKMQSQPEVPAKPRPPVHGVISTNFMCIYWRPTDDNGAPIINFFLERKIRGGEFEKLFIGSGRDVCYVDSDVEPGNMYWYRLRARNSVGLSEWSETSSFKTATTDAPGGGSGKGRESSPDDWLECWDDTKGEIFYFNRITGDRTDKEPEVLRVVRLTMEAAMAALPNDVGVEGANGIPVLAEGQRGAACGDGDENVDGGGVSKSAVGVMHHNGQRKIGTSTFDMEFRRKRFSFLQEVRKKCFSASCDNNDNASLSLKIRREHIFEDSFMQLMGSGVEQLRCKTRIIFVGETGIDSGGLTKDWYLQVCQEMMKEEIGIFKKKGDGGMVFFDHESQIWVDDPERAYKQVVFVGLLVGKAVYDRQLLNLQLAPSIYMNMLSMEITTEDLKTEDPVFFKSMEWMLSNDITDVIFETFSVEQETKSATGEAVVIEFVQGGKDMLVTEDNKHEYISKVVEWRSKTMMKECLSAFFEGLSMLIPISALCIFDLKELQLLINGKPDFDVDEIRAATVFQGNYNHHSLVVQWFWQALRSMTPEIKCQFLKFVTGSNRIPLDGLDPPFNVTYASLEEPKVKINETTQEGGSEDDSGASNSHTGPLPRAHTCFNQIVLPEYKSYDQLIDRLTFAIVNTSDEFLMS